jgi:hypothetical protein
MASISKMFNKNTTKTLKLLIRRNYLSINRFEQNMRTIITKTKPNIRQNNNQLIGKNLINLNLNQKCLIHLSPKRYNPIAAIVLRQIAKVVALLTGRFASNQSLFVLLFKYKLNIN